MLLLFKFCLHIFILVDYLSVFHVLDHILEIILNIWCRIWYITWCKFIIPCWDNLLNLLFLYDFFIFSHLLKILRFDKATYLSLLYKFILSERLSIRLCGSKLLLFFEFINIVSIFYYICIEFIILIVFFFSCFFCLIQRIYNLTDFI